MYNSSNLPRKTEVRVPSNTGGKQVVKASKKHLLLAAGCETNIKFYTTPPSPPSLK
jgi:hypothetical protein